MMFKFHLHMNYIVKYITCKTHIYEINEKTYNCHIKIVLYYYKILNKQIIHKHYRKANSIFI